MEIINGVIHVKVSLRQIRQKQGNECKVKPKLLISNLHRSNLSLAIPSEFSPRLRNITKTLGKFPQTPVKSKNSVANRKSLTNLCKRKVNYNQENASIGKNCKKIQSSRHSPTFKQPLKSRNRNYSIANSRH